MTRRSGHHTLRYRTSAQQWTDALPLGNGRLGAMVYGGPGHDRWQLNDDTCWSGRPGFPAGPTSGSGWLPARCGPPPDPRILLSILLSPRRTAYENRS